eukprot:m.29758 g.29758  ORF g.29758 m.29758 type:complete len:61 (-) comp11973_c0_seq2:97-279(-)
MPDESCPSLVFVLSVPLLLSHVVTQGVVRCQGIDAAILAELEEIQSRKETAALDGQEYQM